MAGPLDGSVRPVVAVINSSEETAGLLRELLEDEGSISPHRRGGALYVTRDQALSP